MTIFTVVFAMNSGIKYGVNLSVYHLSSLQAKAKLIRKSRMHKIILMCRKQTSITGVSSSVLQRNKAFRTPLE